MLTGALLANILSDRGRTKVMAIYATAISAGFAAGLNYLGSWLFHTHALLPNYGFSTAYCLAYSQTTQT